MATISVVGAGAIGCYYGLQLLRAGNDVHFLFRGHESEVVAADGLQLYSPGGDYLATDVGAAASWDELPASDVVVVAVKSLANEDVAPRLAAVVKEGGTVLLIQNGMGAEAVYREHLPDGVTLIAGLAFIAVERRNVREIHHFAHGSLTIAQDTADEEPAGVTEQMRQVVADFDPVQAVETVPDLLLARYQKLLWTTPFNPLSVILNARTDDLMANEQTVALIKRIMHEVQAVAAAQGRTLGDDIIDLLLEVTRQLEPYSPSMKVDWDNGRPMEVGCICEEPMRRAETFGVDVPALQTICEQMSLLQQRCLSNAS